MFPFRTHPQRMRRRLSLQSLEERTQPAGLRVALISDAVAQATQIQAAATPGVIAVTFDAAAANWDSLAGTLQQISAAHGGAKFGHLGLIAHGRSGSIDIGGPETASPQSTWESWRELLTPTARLDLYACRVAADAAGRAFVNNLADLTGADVYASTDAVGSAPGADLDWEYRTAMRTSAPLLRPAVLKRIDGLLLEDAFEDNDSIPITASRPEGTANSPNFGPVTGGKTIAAVLEDDSDIYRFTTLGPSTRLHYVSIAHAAAAANLDMALYDAAGNAIAYAQAGGGTDSISLYGLASGTYYVEVYPQSAGVLGTNYDLRIQAPADTSDDLYETNNSIAQVNSHTAGATNSPNLGSLTSPRTIAGLVQDDSTGYDYFRFETLGPSTHENFISIEFDADDGQLDLALLDSAGSAIAYAQAGGDIDTISLAGLQTGTYYALAYSQSSVRSAMVKYDLHIKPPADTADDAFEFNDSIAQVANAPVGEVNSPNLGVVAGSRSILGLVQDDNAGYDYFRFVTTAPGTPQHFVSIALNSQDGQLDLALFDSVGTALAYSQAGGDTDSITMNGRPAGTYYVLPYSQSNVRSAIASYDLHLNLPGSGAGLVGPVTVTEGDGGFTNAVFTVVRTDGSGTASVSYATADGSATLADQDYQDTSGTLNFAAGELSKTITVPVRGDLFDEADETLFVNLSNATGFVLNTTQAVGTIVNDDAAGILQFSAPTYSVAEAALKAFIKVTRTGGADGQVTVRLTTDDGSAVAPDDYADADGTITFEPGQTSKIITVFIVDDADSEGAETINLTLLDPTGGATLGALDFAELTIQANDVKPGTLAFSTATYGAGEKAGTATITVLRQGGDDGVVTVKYATSNKTALVGLDYIAETGTLTFADGETVQTFEVQILDDNLYEPSETLGLTLSAPTGGAKLATPRVATLTIASDEGLMNATTFVAGAGNSGQIKVIDGPTGAVRATIQAFPTGYKAGVRVAVGDVNGDGYADIVAAGGPNGSSTVRVFDGFNGTKMPGLLGEFSHGLALAGGVHVAAGDVNGDNHADILVSGSGLGAQPHVKVFDGLTRQLLSAFDVFVGTTQPVTVAVGDLDDDGAVELIAATGGAGGGGGLLGVYSVAGNNLRNIDVPDATGPISVAVGDLNNDRKREIIIGSSGGGGPHVKVLDGSTGAVLRTIAPYPPTFKGGVRVAVGDVNGDGTLDVISAGAEGPMQKVKAFEFGTGLEIKSYRPFGSKNSNGVFVA